MLGLFQPSINFINRLKYRQKLILLATIGIVIVFALMYEVSKQASYQLSFSNKELAGLETGQSLFSLMKKMQNYRAVNDRILNNLGQEDELRDARLDVDNAFIQVSEVLKEYPNLELDESLKQIKHEWEILKVTKDQTPSYGRNSDIIPNLQAMIIKNCDNSNLTLDPEVDSFYLIDAYCTLIPRFVDNIKTIHELGAASIYTLGINQTNLDYIYVIATVTKRFSLPAINDNIEKAIHNNKTLTNEFEILLKNLNQDTDKALQTLNDTVIIEKFNYPLEDYNNHFAAVERDINQLTEVTERTISELIQTRISKLKRMFFYNIAVVVFGLLIFIYLFIGIYLSIMQSIRKLVSGSNEIAKGNLKAKVKLDSQDELSQVGDSFNMMRETLRSIVYELHHVVTAVSKGDLSQRVDLNNKEGFSKELSSNINKMIDVFDDMIKDITKVLDFLSKGNLTIRVTREYKGLFAQLKNYVNDTIDDLESLIKNIKTSTETIKHAAEEISLGNIDLEKRTERQAASLEETSISVNKMNNTVQDNTENAKHAHEYVQATSRIALEGGEVVNQVVKMMNAINESARQIAEITNVIDSIAFQTNILALNAAVEAARAGEQGRGFSVVASEIRNLAQRSSVSAQDIKALINTSVEQVTSGKTMADEAGKTMKQVVDSVKNVTNAMSEILNASIDQAFGVEQINTAISQMDQVTQQNSALVEEAARASEALKKQMEQMNELVNVFKLSYDSPTTKIKSYPMRSRKQIEENDSIVEDEESKIDKKDLKIVDNEVTNLTNEQEKTPEIIDQDTLPVPPKKPNIPEKPKTPEKPNNPDEWVEF